jgi:radical SAM protein with 4Fe4S-binding SPASM domain
MNLETAKKITKEFNKNKIDNLLIMGGEPLLNWDVTKYFIENAKGYKTIITNGTLINKEIAQTLNREDCLVIISMDGLEETHNQHRHYNNKKSVLEDVKKGYIICKEHGCKMGIFSVANKYNCDNLASTMYQMIKKFKPKVLGVSFPHYTSFANLDIDSKTYSNQMINLYKLTKDLDINILQISKKLNPLINQKFNLMSCNIAGKQKTFYPNGKETLCTKFDGINQKNFNIDRQFFIKRLPIYNLYCRNCEAIGICGGGCPWDALNRSSDKQVDKDSCIFTKSLLKEYLWDCFENENKERNN